MMRILISIIILVTLFNFGCSKQIQQKKAPPKIIVCPAELRKEKPSKTVVGQAVALEKVALKARITGFIEKQAVEDGAFVKKGDSIFLIQKTQYEAEVLSAQGNVEKAQSTLEDVTINYNRQKYLAAKKAVSQRDFDLAAAKLGNAQGGLKLAQASLIEAKLNLTYTEIIAPFDGQIGIPIYDPGNLVTPMSDALVEIVMMDPMLIQFNLVEQNVLDYIEQKYSDKKLSGKPNKIALAKNIIVKLIMSNGREYPSTGTIDYADNVIDSLTGSIIIRAIFNNPQHLLIPGSYVTVILERKEPIDTLLVPQDAIQSDQLGSFVYVLQKDNTVKYTSVTVGAVYGIGIAVSSGIKANDLVVFQGLQKIRDGIKVTPKTIKLSEIDDKAGKAGKKNTKTKSTKADVDSLKKVPDTEDSTDTVKNTDSDKTVTKQTQKLQSDKINPETVTSSINAQNKGLDVENVIPHTSDKKFGAWKYRDGSENSAIENAISEGNKEISTTQKNINKIKGQNILTTEVKPDNEITTLDGNEIKKIPAIKTIDSNEQNNSEAKPQENSQGNVQ